MNITLVQNSKTSVKAQIGEFDVIVDRPVEKGGGGEGLMGGQHLLIGIGGCFCSTFFAAAQARDVLVSGFKVQLDASVSKDLPKRFTDISLTVSYEKCSSPKEFEKLLNIAEAGCIAVNTVRNGLSIKIKDDHGS